MLETPHPTAEINGAPDFLAGSGEMASMMRDFDWAATDLGPPWIMASKPEDGRPDRVDLPLCDVDGLGSEPEIFLQRRLPPHGRDKTGLGSRIEIGQGLGGDLAGHRASHRAGVEHRRGHLGRRIALVSRAPGLSRRNLPHLFLQPAGRRRWPDQRDVMRRYGRNRTCRRGAAPRYPEPACWPPGIGPG